MQLLNPAEYPRIQIQAEITALFWCWAKVGSFYSQGLAWIMFCKAVCCSEFVQQIPFSIKHPEPVDPTPPGIFSLPQV